VTPLKPVVPREQALRDVEAAVDYYVREAGGKVAVGFIGALERTYASIARHPGAGTPRYGMELALPDLRCKSIGRYPYLVFYVDRGKQIEVWRVLHGVRDIPASLRDLQP
jgi:toxin ParE1/3/4